MIKKCSNTHANYSNQISLIDFQLRLLVSVIDHAVACIDLSATRGPI